jgi:hypothetical protein
VGIWSGESAGQWRKRSSVAVAETWWCMLEEVEGGLGDSELQPEGRHEEVVMVVTQYIPVLLLRALLRIA